MSELYDNIPDIDLKVESYLSSGSDVNLKTIDFCSLWHTVRPILIFVKALLFWKPKWQTVLKQLIDSLDATCNSDELIAKNDPEPEPVPEPEPGISSETHSDEIKLQPYESDGPSV